MNHLRHQKHTSNYTLVLKVKNRPLELENDSKPIKISVNAMDKFENKETTKKRIFTENTWYDWYDWLINHILEPTKNIVGGYKI